MTKKPVLETTLFRSGNRVTLHGIADTEENAELFRECLGEFLERLEKIDVALRDSGETVNE